MKNIITVIALLTIVSIAKGQNANDSLTQIDTGKVKQQATNFLQSFIPSVTKENYKALGFDSLENLSSLSIDKIFRADIIALDDLKKYKTSENPLSIIRNVNRAACTVKNSKTGLTKLMIDLEQSKGSWTVKGFANSNISKAFNQIEKNILQMNLSLVRIPSLNTYFLAFNDSKQITIYQFTGK